MKRVLLIIITCILLCSPQVMAFTFTDDFSGSSIDPFWWTQSTFGGNTISLVGQHVEMYQATTNGSAGLAFNYPLIGDFDVQADFKLNNWNLGGYEQQRVGLGGTQASVERVSDWWFGGEIYLTYWAGATWWTGSPTTTDLEGKLRLVRVGSTINGYFWNESLNDWQLAPRTPPDYSDPFQFSLSIWSGYTGTQIGNIIEWDNVYVNSPGTPDPRGGGPVPEPGTMLLLGSGLIGLAGYGRKKLFKR